MAAYRQDLLKITYNKDIFWGGFSLNNAGAVPGHIENTMHYRETRQGTNAFSPSFFFFFLSSLSESYLFY